MQRVSFFAACDITSLSVVMEAWYVLKVSLSYEYKKRHEERERKSSCRIKNENKMRVGYMLCTGKAAFVTVVKENVNLEQQR